MSIALSYSRLSTFETCPRKFKSQYIDKDYPDEGDNYFFKKGHRKHQQLENYVLSKNNPMAVSTFRYDDDIEAMFPMIDKICNSMPDFAAEQKMAVDHDFKPCGWFDKSVMFRSIVDFRAKAGNLMTVIDWKTGKLREYDSKPTGQLHLTAAIMFAHHEEVTDIITSYAFIDHRQNLKTEFDRSMELVDPFLKAHEEVNSETEWKPKQNEYCKYCLLTNEQCPYK